MGARDRGAWRSLRRFQLVRLNQHLGWQSQTRMEAADHFDRERSAAVEQVRHLGSTSDVGLEIFSSQSAAFHEVQNCLDGVRWENRVPSLLVRLDEREPMAGSLVREKTIQRYAQCTKMRLYNTPNELVVDARVPMNQHVSEGYDPRQLRNCSGGSRVHTVQLAEGLADDLELPLDRAAKEVVRLVVRERLVLGESCYAAGSFASIPEQLARISVHRSFCVRQ